MVPRWLDRVRCKTVCLFKDCNPESPGAVTITDIDNDVGPNVLNEFTTDPLRTSLSWHPSQNSFTTLAYEGLKPFLGDSDFNDLVIIANF